MGEAIPLGFSADGAMQLVCKITEKGNLKKKKKDFGLSVFLFL